MEMYSLILLVVSFILGMFILYFVIKTAVVKGIKDSGILNRNDTSLSELNTAQDLLKSRYEKGEITFETYVQECKKLNKLI